MCPVCFNEAFDGQQCSVCGFSKANYSQFDNTYPCLPLGTRLHNGRYTIGRVLGVGGFGITYLARDEHIQRKIAIKEFYPRDIHEIHRTESNQIFSTTSVERHFTSGLNDFLKEARTLSKFEEHPNIVTVLDFFHDNGTAYMVMVYLDGITLQEYLYLLNDQKKVDGQSLMPQVKAIDTIMIVLDALREVHARNYYHRDIKPQNVMLADNVRPVLIDFGSAKLAIGSRSQQLHNVVSHGYSPLEQYQSDGKQQGPWTDVYAVCATLYYMVTGVVPISAVDRVHPETDPLKRPDEVVNGLSPTFGDVVMKGLSLRPADRYQSALDLQRALSNSYPNRPVYDTSPGNTLLDINPVQKKQKGRERPPRKKTPPQRSSSSTPARSGRSYIPILLLSILTLALAGLFYAIQVNDTPAEPDPDALFYAYQAAVASNDPQEANTVRDQLLLLQNQNPDDLNASYRAGLLHYLEGDRYRKTGDTQQSEEELRQCASVMTRVANADEEWTFPESRVLGSYCHYLASSSRAISLSHVEHLQEFTYRYPTQFQSQANIPLDFLKVAHRLLDRAG